MLSLAEAASALPREALPLELSERPGRRQMLKTDIEVAGRIVLQRA
jgi:hypothetical protein